MKDMKMLWLFLLIPLTQLQAASAPGCQELSGILAGLEKDLQSKHSSELCEKTSEDFSALPFVDNTGASKTLSPEQAALAFENRCKNLSVVENDLRRYENQLTLLTGFEKLKADIRAQKELVASRSPATAGRAALQFQDAVLTAQSLELLVNTVNGTSTIARDLKLAMAAATPPVDFTAELTKICTQRTPAPEAGTRDACNSEAFQPNPAAIAELTYLLTNGELDQAQHDAWREALRIAQTDGSAYSFDQMKIDLEQGLANSSDNRPSFSRQELLAIQNLPDFSNATSLDVVNSLNDSKKDVVLKQQFDFLVQDLALRQKFEIQSKLSLTFSQFTDKFDSDSEREKCLSVNQNYDQVSGCIQALRAVYDSLAAGSDKSQLEQILESVSNSEAYATQLQESSVSCLERIRTAVNEKDDEFVCDLLMTENQADLQNKILAMSVLRDKIVSENGKTFKLRNFAAETIENDCTSSVIETSVGLCDPGLVSSVSPEASLLISDAMQISLVYAKPTEATDISELCSETNQLTVQRSLCLVLDGDDPASEEESSRPDPTAYTPSPVAFTSTYNPVTQALALGAQNLAQVLSQEFRMSQAQGPSSPYPSYAPTFPPTIGGGLPAAAAAGGAFRYTPTPGLPLYTSQLPGVSSWATAPSSTPAGVSSLGSSYFSTGNFGQ